MADSAFFDCLQRLPKPAPVKVSLRLLAALLRPDARAPAPMAESTTPQLAALLRFSSARDQRPLTARSMTASASAPMVENTTASPAARQASHLGVPCRQELLQSSAILLAVKLESKTSSSVSRDSRMLSSREHSAGPVTIIRLHHLDDV